jgi:hypothetical protein
MSGDGDRGGGERERFEDPLGVVNEFHKTKPIIPPGCREKPVSKRKEKKGGREKERERGREEEEKKRGKEKRRGSRSQSATRGNSRRTSKKSGSRSLSREATPKREKSSSRESSPDPFLDVEVGTPTTPIAPISVRKKRAVRGRMGHGLKTMNHMREGEERSLQKDVGVVEDLLKKERAKQEQRGKKAAVLDDLVGGNGREREGKVEKEKEKERGKGKEKKKERGGGGVSYFTEGMPTGRGGGAGGSSGSLNEDFLESMAKVTKKRSGGGGGGGGKAGKVGSTPSAAAPSSGASTASTPATAKFKIPATTTTTTNPNSKKLEGGWEEVKLDDGRVYYYHRLTRASRWEKPEGAMAEAMEQRIMEEERKKEQAIKERKKAREAEKKKLEEIEEEKNDISKMTTAAVKKWATGKGVHLLLNDLGDIFEGAPVPSAPLTAQSSGAEVKRAYMKAIRHVHPDKIGANASVKMKLTSQAVFGALSSAYERRKRVEG